MNRHTAIVALGILASALARAHAVDGEVSGPVAVLSFQDLSDQRSGEPFEETVRAAVAELADSLGLRLVTAPGESTDGDGRGGDWSPGGIRAAAAEARADVAFVGFTLLDGRSVYFQMKIYDVSQGAVVASVFERQRPGLSFYNAMRAAIARMEAPLTAFLAGDGDDAPRVDRVASIVFRSPDEGATIRFSGQPIGTVTDGSLVAPYSPLAVGTTVPVRVEKRGYHPADVRVTLDSVENDVSLPPLLRSTRYAVTAWLDLGLFTGAGTGARAYLVPDASFVEVDAALRQRFGDRAALRGDLSVAAGGYMFFPVTSPVRVSFSAGGGFSRTWIHSADGAPRTDWYLSLADPTIEWSAGRRTLFLRAGFHYALGTPGSYDSRGWLLTAGVLPRIAVGMVVARS